MTTTQRYISKELTHLIGKELPDDEKRYELLIKIITEGWITHWPHEPKMASPLMITLGARISNNEMYNPSCICFCDIPVTDLDIHMGKYSRFGISFLKSFLALKGASPVFYIANKSSVYMHSKTNRADYFDSSMKAFHEFKEVLYRTVPMPERKDPWRLELHNKFVEVVRFLEFEVFSYIKGFDNTLHEDDDKNYYMEREWRIIGNLKFDLDDVYRVILPKEFAKRFREDMPSYAGQVTLID